MDETEGVQFALVLALATALDLDGVLPMERFIETTRRHALQLKSAGAEETGGALLEICAHLAQGRPPRS